MITRSWLGAASAKAASLIALLLILSGMSAQAAEIRVLTANNMRPTLADLAGEFERATGHRLSITPDSLLAVKDRIRSGGSFDVAVTLRALLEDLAEDGKIMVGSIGDVAKISIVLYVRAGAAKPDIATIDTLRQALRATASVTYHDAAAGTPVAIYFPDLLARLGLAEAMKNKTRLTALGGGFELVARGEVELGVAQIFDFVPPLGPPPGVDLVGPVPEAAQDKLRIAAAVAVSSRETEASLALIRFLSSPAAGPIIVAHGMEVAGSLAQ
jgi:molybdate transport system substrate-binding protein